MSPSRRLLCLLVFVLETWMTNTPCWIATSKKQHEASAPTSEQPYEHSWLNSEAAYDHIST